jgi:FMN phosphatase YigB (HAD superfamily)
VRPFDVVTFDCYGTLIDWETGITKAFQEAAAADGLTLDPAAVLQALFDTRPASEAPEYRSYREILTDAAFRAGLGLQPSDRFPFPRHPRDPRAVSDPRLILDEFPDLVGDRPIGPARRFGHAGRPRTA